MGIAKPRKKQGNRRVRPREEASEEGAESTRAPRRRSVQLSFPLLKQWFPARLFRWVKPATQWAFVLGSATGLAWAGVGYARTSPRFELKDLELRGATHMGEAGILETSGIEMGQNVFQINPHAVESRLQRDPWVRSVDVERRPPGGLRVEVQEWEPVAVASLEGPLLLVAEKGVPFKTLEVGDPTGLPLITGLTAPRSLAEKARVQARLLEATSLISAYATLPNARRHSLEEVRLGMAGEATLVVGQNGTELHLGAGEWDRKLAMATPILRRLSAAGARASKVFLDGTSHPDRVVVRLAGDNGKSRM